MERIAGLSTYIRNQTYRKKIMLPKQVQEDYRLLAQGEYNMNYLFTHPTAAKKMLLRVNCGSQMHLSNQIEYEYHALAMLKDSGRTPVPLYVDGSLEEISKGVMVMEYLPGNALNYRTDLPLAAECLADIHSIKIEDNSGLIDPEHPLEAILQECEEMAGVYMDSSLGNKRIKKQIRRLLDMGWDMVKRMPVKSDYKCCINTELNSTNFLVDRETGRCYLVDWEKPLYGDPAQDLGHFLAPTTTFWKTDVILTPRDIRQFIEAYVSCINNRFPTEDLPERVRTYIPVTCLRGITWCAMAWVQYQQPDKLIVNESTAQKLNAYLSAEFLNEIENKQFTDR